LLDGLRLLARSGIHAGISAGDQRFDTGVDLAFDEVVLPVEPSPDGPDLGWPLSGLNSQRYQLFLIGMPLLPGLGIHYSSLLLE
jgi:hypothetical protein